MTAPVIIQPRCIPRGGGGGNLTDSGNFPIVVFSGDVVVKEKTESVSETVVGGGESWRPGASRAGRGRGGPLPVSSLLPLLNKLDFILQVWMAERMTRPPVSLCELRKATQAAYILSHRSLH